MRALLFSEDRVPPGEDPTVPGSPQPFDAGADHLLPRLFSEASSPPRRRLRARPPPPPRLANDLTRILVAEPDALCQRIIRVLLGNPRISLSIVDHGEAAIDLLAMRWFDLVILDIDSPRMDCAETTRWIRYSMAPWSDIPILGLLAEEQRAMAGRLMSAGLTDWTLKPLSRADFCGKIVKLMPALHGAGL